MRPSNAQLLEIYERTLAKYEAEGDKEMVRIQKKMIEWVKTTRKD